MSELFETFGVNWKLLFIQAVNFGLLLLLLWYFLYRPVLRMIDERREKIAEGVLNAEAAKKELDEAEGKVSAIVSSASREAENIVAKARERADEKGIELVKSAETRSVALFAEVKARAEEERRQVLKSAEADIARAAVLAAEKILHSKPV